MGYVFSLANTYNNPTTVDYFLTIHAIRQPCAPRPVFKMLSTLDPWPHGDVVIGAILSSVV